MSQPPAYSTSSRLFSDDDDDDFESPTFMSQPSLPPRPPISSKQQRAKKVQHSRAASSNRAPLSAEERVRKRAEREKQRALKEAAKQKSRQDRIRAAFEGHQSTTLGRQSSVTIMVSKSMFENESVNDALKYLRLIYPAQIQVVERRMDNLITWQRIRVGSAAGSLNRNDMEDVPMCVFVFHAKEYLSHIAGGTLDEYARRAKASCLTTHQIVFAVCGMDAECARQARLGIGLLGDKGGPLPTDKRAIQDSYVHLYMEHSIRTHDAKDINELSNYLRDVTDAIAADPYKQEQDLVSASLRNKVSRAHASHRTIVFETQSQSQPDSDQDKRNDQSQSDPKMTTPLVRVESVRDLGNIYLSMLCLIPGVTIRKAQAIREMYPTLRSLLDAYDKCKSEKERELVLADVRSGDHNRRLGPALSKVISNILTSDDPNLPIVNNR